jgi:hypothetical protein
VEHCAEQVALDRVRFARRTISCGFAVESHNIFHTLSTGTAENVVAHDATIEARGDDDLRGALQETTSINRSAQRLARAARK